MLMLREPTPANIAQATPSSSERHSIEVILFGCGHGDTILVRLPVDKWVLIDCRLTKHDRTYDRFIEFVEARGITRFEFIFQTHPDYDHFQGMTDLLMYFTGGGRSIGYWCDGGINAPQVRDIAWKELISKSRYEALQECLDRLSEKKLIKFRRIDDDTCHISPKGFPNIRLIPIAPTASEFRAVTRSDSAKAMVHTEAQLETNALSIVLVLSVSGSESSFNVLLCGDAEPAALKAGITRWTDYANQNSLLVDFEVVKVSHHGSPLSHVDELCTMGANHNSVALISAGSRKGLPHAKVLRCWLQHYWRVFITTTRRATQKYNRPMDLLNRAPAQISCETHDIHAQWSIPGGFVCTPESASVLIEHVHAYA